MSGPRTSQKRPRILFACTMNAVRSPMAEGLAKRILGPRAEVASAGVYTDNINPFSVAAMEEIGVDLMDHEPKSLEDLQELEPFDLVITLTPEAHHRALSMTHEEDWKVEYWPTEDPTTATGHREMILEAFRALRDRLEVRIRERFGEGGTPHV